MIRWALILVVGVVLGLILLAMVGGAASRAFAAFWRWVTS